ncbi:MAG TPA: 2-C-methyl-D-erythritol 4-phosphate cytidylyltransferase [Ktedonobacteraceae bacterium]|nr:2-C-methyl-D-erythritol 4-phosphate cytidylyltransferase [Ktedonobacteraceae bacterium]
MQETCSAIIAAAGSSRRMQGHDKLWLPLAGRLTLARTIDVFDASPLIDSIVLVLNEERIVEAEQLCQQEGWRKIVSIIVGGQRRQDSVRLGLNALAHIDPQCRWVMIHDGARPLVTPAMLEAGLQAARQHLAAIAAVPVKDTIKSVEHDFVTATINRSQHVAIQTPQVFSFPLIHSAHNAPEAQQDVTDDAALLERLGHRVAIFPGSYTNIKITTQEDVLIAEAFIKGATIL